MLLLYCLFSPSPEATDEECSANNSNLKKVVSQGRDPNLMLDINGKAIAFKDFAQQLLSDLQPLAETMDSLRADNRHQRSLELQLAKVADSALTPSAQVLQMMTDEKLSFTEFAQHQSLKWQAHFLAENLSADKQALFEELAANSLAAQKALEKASKQDFAAYLSEYYQQYKHEV
jgi:glutamate--cysteine ligase